MNSEYYLMEYIEEFDGSLDNVDIVREFSIGDDNYSVLRRGDGVEFVVLDYEKEDEFIWVSVGEDGDWDGVLGVGDDK